MRSQRLKYLSLSFSRFVLGTDGLWDVLSIHDVSLLVNRIWDPRQASLVLATQARKRREAAKIKIDDIACMVIDINPDAPNRTPAMNGCGCSIS